LNRGKWRKRTLALSACLFVLWWALGTGATLAWFSDADTVRNEFQIGLLNLDVSYKNNNIVTDYEPLQEATKLFNDNALYEPGYTQVVYLKIENKGNVDFNYKVAVTANDAEEAVNVFGQKFYLSNYLRYGIVFADSEGELEEQVKDRLTAKTHITDDMSPLGTWPKNDPKNLDVGEGPHYAALIVHMPEDVDNAANYRGAIVPRVELGVKVYAQQANATMN